MMLVIHADEVVEGVPRDSQHRNLIALGVIEAVEQMNATGAGSGHAHPDAACELGVANGSKGRRFLVPHLDEPQLLLMRAQGLEKAIYADSGNPKIVSTPHSSSRSTTRSETVFFAILLYLSLRGRRDC